MKSTVSPSQKPVSWSSSNDHFSPQHQKTSSQSFDLEEDSPWLDNTLSETFDDSKKSPLCRSVSDSVILLESSCVYGPNSPRSRGSMDLSENLVVWKLKDHFSPKPTFYPGSGVVRSGIIEPDLIQPAGSSSNIWSAEDSRHCARRSRVRRLQYIDELERTVDSLQNSNSELGIRVASLLQHRITLSVENNTLKQQLTARNQEKLLTEGKHRTLKRELESLKNNLAMRKKFPDFRPISLSEEVKAEAVWQMLDMKKLNINHNQ